MDDPIIQEIFGADKAEEFAGLWDDINQQDKYGQIPRLWELTYTNPELVTSCNANLSWTAQAYIAWVIDQCIDHNYESAYAGWVFVNNPNYGLSWTQLRISQMVIEDFVGKYLHTLFERMSNEPDLSLRLAEIIYDYAPGQNQFQNDKLHKIANAALRLLEATYYRLSLKSTRPKLAIRQAIAFVRFLEAQESRECLNKDLYPIRLLRKLSFNLKDAQALRDKLLA